MLKTIIGIKITIQSIERKRKLSQNQPIENQEGVIQRLSEKPNKASKKLALIIKSKLNNIP